MALHLEKGFSSRERRDIPYVLEGSGGPGLHTVHGCWYLPPEARVAGLGSQGLLPNWRSLAGKGGNCNSLHCVRICQSLFSSSVPTPVPCEQVLDVCVLAIVALRVTGNIFAVLALLMKMSQLINDDCLGQCKSWRW